MRFTKIKALLFWSLTSTFLMINSTRRDLVYINTTHLDRDIVVPSYVNVLASTPAFVRYPETDLFIAPWSIPLRGGPACHYHYANVHWGQLKLPKLYLPSYIPTHGVR